MGSWDNWVAFVEHKRRQTLGLSQVTGEMRANLMVELQSEKIGEGGCVQQLAQPLSTQSGGTAVPATDPTRITVPGSTFDADATLGARFIPHGARCEADDGRGPDFGRCQEYASAWVSTEHGDRVVSHFHHKYYRHDFEIAKVTA